MVNDDRDDDDNDDNLSERRERRREWLEERRTRRERQVNVFTREERDRILKMLENHERTRWIWSSIALAAKWVSSVAAATAILIAVSKWGLAEIIKWWSP